MLSITVEQIQKDAQGVADRAEVFGVDFLNQTKPHILGHPVELFGIEGSVNVYSSAHVLAPLIFMQTTGQDRTELKLKEIKFPDAELFFEFRFKAGCGGELNTYVDAPITFKKLKDAAKYFLDRNKDLHLVGARTEVIARGSQHLTDAELEVLK